MDTLMQISQEEAAKLGEGWIKAWNSHNVDKVLSYYDSNILFVSPMALELSVSDTGVVRGIDQLRTYFENALVLFPNLKFKLFHVFVSLSSVIIFYQSLNDILAAEAMEIDPATKKITRVVAHFKNDKRGR